MSTTIKNGDDVFVSYDGLSHGDYSGSRSLDVEMANVEHLLETHTDIAEYRESDIGVDYSSYNGDISFNEDVEAPSKEEDIILVRGGFGGKAIYIREDSELDDEISASLHNSPVLNDEKHREVQVRLQEEAFHDFGESDLTDLMSSPSVAPRLKNVELDEDNELVVDENYTSEQLKEIWDKVVENDQGSYEGSGFYIDVEKSKEVVIETANDLKEDSLALVKKPSGPSLSM